MKKLVLQKILLQQTVLGACFRPRGIPRVCFYFLFYGTEFRVVFSSAEWFITEFWEFDSIFVPQYRIPSIFLFFGMVRNESILFRGTAGNPLEQTTCSVYSVFWGILYIVGNCQPYRCCYKCASDFLTIAHVQETVRVLGIRQGGQQARAHVQHSPQA